MKNNNFTAIIAIICLVSAAICSYFMGTMQGTAEYVFGAVAVAFGAIFTFSTARLVGKKN